MSDTKNKTQSLNELIGMLEDHDFMVKEINNFDTNPAVNEYTVELEIKDKQIGGN